MDGFFTGSQLQSMKVPLSMVPLCGKCGLSTTCKTPKMKVAGKGKRKILVVGEAPGQTEDIYGKPFVGKSGRDLQDTLLELGVNLFQDCWVTNSLICRPEGNVIKDPKAVSYCRPNVLNAIKDLNPEVIILLGAKAVESVIGYLWKSEGVGGVGRWAGFQIPSQKYNAWICPTFHPSYVLRQEDSRDVITRLFFRKHLQAAVELEGRPWGIVPNYSKNVQLLYDSERAASAVKKFIAQGKRPAAFDYETTTLKPDSKTARIVSAALSDGKSTLAYPWVGEAILATQVFLRSDLPKIAANIQFEENWTWKEFGHGVNHWLPSDTVVNAHILDHRKDVCSVKFQAFALLGQETYDEHIKQFLRSENEESNKPNRIHEVDLQQLLLYNGMDALLEYNIWRIQKKELGL